MLTEIKEHEDFFKIQEKVRSVNESLRPGESKSAGDLFGVEGSFKKLELD